MAQASSDQDFKSTVSTDWALPGGLSMGFRSHQLDAIEAAREVSYAKRKVTVAHITPGGGKTILASKADGPEPWAVITYTDEPSPETGHVGWCWWAMGSMGDAPSYEAARDAAVAEIQRRVDRRMAVL